MMMMILTISMLPTCKRKRRRRNPSLLLLLLMSLSLLLPLPRQCVSSSSNRLLLIHFQFVVRLLLPLSLSCRYYDNDDSMPPTCQEAATTSDKAAARLKIVLSVQVSCAGFTLNFNTSIRKRDIENQVEQTCKRSLRWLMPCWKHLSSYKSKRSFWNDFSFRLLIYRPCPSKPRDRPFSPPTSGRRRVPGTLTTIITITLLPP